MNRHILIGVLLCCAITAPVVAQPDASARREYVRFEIDRNFEKLLNKRFQLEKQLEPLKALFKQIADHPEKLNINLDDLKGIKFDDDDVKNELQKWAKSEPDLKKKLSEWMEKNKSGKAAKDVEQLQNALKKDVPSPRPELSKARTIPVQTAKPRADTLAEAAAKAMKDTRVGDWVRESPAMQRAFEDLQKSIHDAPASRRNWTEFAGKLRLPEGKLLEIGEQTLERLRDLPRPSFANWAGKVNLPGLDKLRPPEVNLHAIPKVNTPAMPTLDKAAIWTLSVALFVLVGWQLVRRAKRSPVSEDERAKLGPWPVRPEHVSTRSDFLRAFDYLALLTLGLSVQSWNHQAIARRWTQRFPACGATASALAALYEQVRYAQGAYELTSAEQVQARQWLLQLAEAQ